MCQSPFTPQEDSWHSFVDPRAIVRLEGLGKFKKIISLGLDLATFRLVAFLFIIYLFGF
jgi:hypothetical protein